MKKHICVLGLFVAIVSIVCVCIYQWNAPEHTYTIGTNGLKFYGNILRTKVVSERGEFEATEEAHAKFHSQYLFRKRGVASVTLREKGLVKQIVDFEFE